MSNDALDLLELRRLAIGGSGVTQRRLREVANRLIQAGVRDFRGGC